MLNLLYHDNPIGYQWAQYFARLRDFGESRPGRPGLPVLPSIGVEVRW